MTAPTAARAVGDKVWVHAFGNWRTGVVVKVGRTRLRVRYVSRRDGTAEREQWFPANQVHDGNLPAGQEYHCPRLPSCGYTIYGPPGRTAEQLRDDHNAQRHPNRTAERTPEKCRRCVYGEPVDHTCDPGQQARHHIEMTSRAGGDPR